MLVSRTNLDAYDEVVRDIVRMSQTAPSWMFAVSPSYAPDMCMYVCPAFLCVFYCVSICNCACACL